jgi:flagellar protein FliO/FliZ
MVVRLVLSLAFIAGVLWFAARVAKKRGIGQGNGLIEVVARQRMGRASSVSVVRIADRVLVVGATEEQVTLLAEVDGDVVADAIAERRLAVAQPAVAGTPGVLAGSVFDRNGWTTFVSQLRERTVRR